jgi:transcriptional regulator GlxA family with amidase domain
LRLRIAEAQRLLRSTGLPLKAIAVSVGFCDQYALSNRFLAVVGERPSAWRRSR